LRSTWRSTTWRSTTSAHGFHAATATVLDLGGGLVATGPGGGDWADPDTRKILEKYFAAAVPAEQRLRLINLIGDLRTGSWGGYQSVLATHAEGSIEAEKMQIARSFDSTRAQLRFRACRHLTEQFRGACVEIRVPEIVPGPECRPRGQSRAFRSSAEYVDRKIFTSGSKVLQLPETDPA
jgi:hypothetical protein